MLTQLIYKYRYRHPIADKDHLFYLGYLFIEKIPNLIKSTKSFTALWRIADGLMANSPVRPHCDRTSLRRCVRAFLHHILRQQPLAPYTCTTQSQTFTNKIRVVHTPVVRVRCSFLNQLIKLYIPLTLNGILGAIDKSRLYHKSTSLAAHTPYSRTNTHTPLQAHGKIKNVTKKMLHYTNRH